jgi:hypothetical protein
LLAFGSLPVWAGNDSTGTVGAAFLKLGNGVRAPAMGEAFSAVANDPSAIYWNPAGLAQIESRELSLSYNLWLQNTSFSTLQYVYPLTNGQAVGVSVFYMSYGDIMETTATSRTGTGRNISPSGTVSTVSYALGVNENLYCGANLKLLSQNIDTYQQSGSAFDLGLLMKDFRGMNLALVVQNLGSMGSDTLPQTMKLGLSKGLLDDRLLLAIDLSMPNDNNATVALGGEYKINPRLVIRGGYKAKAEEGSGGNLGIGLGLSLSGFTVDYAYVPYGDLGSAHRIGITLNL